MPDQFKKMQVGRESPGTQWAAVTPSDSVDIPFRPRFLYVTGAGNIVARGSDGVNATFAVAAGAILPIGPDRILATGTTATGIVGCR